MLPFHPEAILFIMKPIYLTLLTVLVLAGCGQNEQGGGQADKGVPLAQARQGFKTRLVRQESARKPVPQPPAELFRTVRYDSPAGKLAAYLTPDPKDGKKHPAIIWITGGDCDTIDEGCWKEGPPADDQSASAFRKA